MNIAHANITEEGNEALSAIIAVFQTFQDPLVFADADRRILWCNRGLEILLGYTLAELQGRSTRLLYAENDDFTQTGKVRFNNAGDPSRQTYAMSYRHKDGSIIRSESTGWRVPHGDGSVAGYAAIIRDVTEVTKVEDALNKLYAISSTQKLSGPEKIDAILALGCSFFKLPVALVSMIRGETYTVLFSNSALMDIPPGTQFQLGTTFCKDTINSNEPLAVHAADLAEGSCGHPAYEEFGLRAYIGIPLIVDGERIGTLGFSSPMRRKPFSTSEFDIMKLCGAWIAQELSLEMSYQALSRAASQDWLTGAATNREFRSELNAVFSDCKRQSQDAQLILFDIDHFKLVNDQFGHDRGDTVLRMLAETVQHLLGPNTPLYRIGGEEFAIVLRKGSNDAAIDLAEQIRHAIEQIDFGFEQGFQITTSLGIAAFNGEFETESNWVKCADMALYSAKNSGRNRVASNNQAPSLRIHGSCPVESCPGHEKCGGQNCPA
ncbi:diguanylate cyclase [uncultured Pelagimonas sp.]|uniref:sensor domain-containing diguanylate cyclase n=1 Tax=uncultured Pelagimonas sp. TaxID=1618102 RepID=UPI00260E2B2E|nr:diguanylate cyclase [uncultured Pelagimonas sp.]